MGFDGFGRISGLNAAHANAKTEGLNAFDEETRAFILHKQKKLRLKGGPKPGHLNPAAYAAAEEFESVRWKANPPRVAEIAKRHGVTRYMVYGTLRRLAAKRKAERPKRSA